MQRRLKRTHACNRMQRRLTQAHATAADIARSNGWASLHSPTTRCMAAHPRAQKKKQAQKNNVNIISFIDAKALDNPYNVKKLWNLAMMLVMLVQGCWSTSRMSTKTCFETDPSRPERPPMKQVQNDTECCQDVSPMRSTLVHVGQCGTDRRRR